ncbi:hypothetical protein DFJ74DRAFT_737141 [Hyaloraphidium curvatum]|nr:hypothetical protein DFJ74DRAFT_737141 [Hyaloraphidium curvatum]
MKPAGRAPPPWPPELTPTAWAALFPAFPTPRPPPDLAPSLAALATPPVASVAREESPMTSARLLGSLGGAARALVRLQFAMRPVGAAVPFPVQRAVYEAGKVFAIALVWVFNGAVSPASGTRQLVAMTVATAVQIAGWEVPTFRGRLYARSADPWMPEHSAKARESTLDGHIFAVVARYRLLERAAGEPERPGSELERFLVRHDPHDILCSCPNDTCCGGDLRKAQVFYIATFALMMVGGFSCHLIIMWWTVLVTFAQATWATAWSATLLAFFTAAAGSHVFFAVIGTSAGVSNVAVFRIEKRLRRRAMQFCLDDLLTRLAAAADDPDQRLEHRRPEGEAYVALHASLVSAWRARLGVAAGTSFVVRLALLGACIAALIVVFASSCITGPILADLAYMSVTILLFDLANLAAANSEPEQISAQYRSAAYELRSLAFAAPPSSPLAAAVTWHERILRGFAADAGLHRARSFGAIVDAGMVRTVGVTAFTVAVGLWSVLRSAGVGVTIDMACPGG